MSFTLTPVAEPNVQTKSAPEVKAVETKTGAAVTELADAIAPKADETKPEEKKEDAFSPKFAALAKREKAIVQRDKEIKAKELGNLQREESLKAREAKLSQIESLKSEGKYSDALALLGITYGELTDYYANEERPSAQKVAQSEASKIAKSEIEAWKKEQAEKAAKDANTAKADAEKQFETKLNEFRGEVSEFLKSKPDEFELVNFEDANDEGSKSGTNLVLAIIEEHFQLTSTKGTPEVMSTEDAAKLAEKYFEDRADKILASKKFKAKANPQPEGDQKLSESAPPRTLTNNLTPSVSSATSGNVLSREERIKRALSMPLPGR